MEKKINIEILEDPITRHMRSEITLLHQDQTIGQALEILRSQDLNDKIVYFYVVDKQNRLAGVVPVRRMISAELSATVDSIMIRHVVSLPDQASVMEACQMILEHRLLALPIVNEEQQPVGVVDVGLFTDEVHAMVRQFETDNVFQLIGVHVAMGRKTTPWGNFRDRFPWLLCNIVSGLLCALIASRFQLLISQVTVLALFLTVVLALGESVSMQAMTLTLQSFVQARATWRHALAALRRELGTAALLGTACGALVGLVVFLWQKSLMLAVAIGASVPLAIVTACLLGVMIPTAVRLARIDPKIASGPIVLASADVATLVFYFNAAQWLVG